MVAIMILQSANFQEKSLDLAYLHSTQKDAHWNIPGLHIATAWV